MPPNSDRPKDRNVPRKDAVRQARNASSRPKAFYWLLGAIALIGVAAIGYVATKPKAGPSDVLAGPDTSNAGPAQGYLMVPAVLVRRVAVDLAAVAQPHVTDGHRRGVRIPTVIGGQPT